MPFFQPKKYTYYQILLAIDGAFKEPEKAASETEPSETEPAENKIIDTRVVIVVYDGKIIADDTHTELAKNNQRYRTLLCLDQESSS